MTERWEELTEEERVALGGLKSKPGSHVDCGNGGAPRGAWPCPAGGRNRHQRRGTRVDLETAGDFAPQGAESSLDLSWGISAPVLAFAPPARFHLLSCRCLCGALLSLQAGYARRAEARAQED
jgi:hypothetical protein